MKKLVQCYVCGLVFFDQNNEICPGCGRAEYHDCREPYMYKLKNEFSNEFEKLSPTYDNKEETQ